MPTQELAEKEFEEKIINSQNITLLDFWTEGCGPCKALSEELEKVSRQRSDVFIYKANVEKENELAGRLGVMAAPTLFFFRNGQIKKKTIGFKSLKSILEILDNIDEE